MKLHFKHEACLGPKKRRHSNKRLSSILQALRISLKVINLKVVTFLRMSFCTEDPEFVSSDNPVDKTKIAMLADKDFTLMECQQSL